WRVASRPLQLGRQGGRARVRRQRWRRQAGGRAGRCMSREKGRQTRGAYERGPALRCGDAREGMLACLVVDGGSGCEREPTRRWREEIQKYPANTSRAVQYSMYVVEVGELGSTRVAAPGRVYLKCELVHLTQHTAQTRGLSANPTPIAADRHSPRPHHSPAVSWQQSAAILKRALGVRVPPCRYNLPPPPGLESLETPLTAALHHSARPLACPCKSRLRKSLHPVHDSSSRAAAKCIVASRKVLIPAGHVARAACITSTVNRGSPVLGSFARPANGNDIRPTLLPPTVQCLHLAAKALRRCPSSTSPSGTRSVACACTASSSPNREPHLVRIHLAMPCTIVRRENIECATDVCAPRVSRPFCSPALSGGATDTGYRFKCAMLCFIVSYLPRHAARMLALRMSNYCFPMLAYA
ncbi:hypothetical protein DE146DRAFT_764818, partial [Phaeosphaeria sp. MPI-PUGE-AT-0046c]